MSQQWFECVCQFFQAQSASINGILTTLGNQHTISDIQTNDILEAPTGPTGGLPAASPMTYFLILLLMIWGYMFVFARKKADTEKPTNFKPDGGDDAGADRGPDGNGGNAIS
jgi:hypothetical protein